MVMGKINEMIQVKLIQLEGVYTPERELTAEEKQSVIFTLFDGVNANYYQQGDELPIIEE